MDVNNSTEHYWLALETGPAWNKEEGGKESLACQEPRSPETNSGMLLEILKSIWQARYKEARGHFKNEKSKFSLFACKVVLTTTDRPWVFNGAYPQDSHPFISAYLLSLLHTLFINVLNSFQTPWGAVPHAETCMRTKLPRFQPLQPCVTRAATYWFPSRKLFQAKVTI